MSTLDMDFPDPRIQNPFTALDGHVWTHNGITWIKETKGVLPEAPIDGNEYGRKDGLWVIITHPASDVNEAPINGRYFARFNGAWAEVTLNLGGIGDAPSTGEIFGRRNAVWTTITLADLPALQDELDKKSNIDHTHQWTDIIDPATGFPYLLDPITGLPQDVVLEAPKNGKEYVRKDGQWVEATPLSALVQHDAVTIMQPQIEDDATLLFAAQQMAILAVHGHVISSDLTDGVRVNIFFSANRDTATSKIFASDIVINSKSGQSFTSIDTPQIPINSWVWLEIVSISGNPEMVHLTIDFQKG